MIIRELTVDEYEMRIPRLADILIDCVEAGAGVSFMAPLSRDIAEAFWRKQVADVSTGATHLFVAQLDGLIIGAVMLCRAWAPNQPHRAEVSKLLVHNDFRQQGVATKLMQALEDKARGMKLALITFDAVTGSDAWRLYQRLGFQVVGDIPGYALSPYGRMDDTTVFYKAL
jgi:ribosomal protein S18 acetylase RimI-like enzyme